MTTYVLIPREGSQTAAAMSVGVGGAPRQRGFALRELLQRVRLPGGTAALAASDGSVEDETGALEGLATDTHEASIVEAGAPRTLEAIGAVIVDDLDEDKIDDLIAEGIDVIANFVVPLETPVAKSVATSEENWHLGHINVAAARAKGLNGAGVRIGILDTGIDANHPEFAGKSVEFVEFNDRGFKISAVPRDAGDHGTHVSGIAAGVTCGVAPDADLAVAAVLTFPDPTTGQLSGFFAQILAGVNWLLQSNFGVGGAIDEVAVINASLGGRGYNSYLYSVLNLAQIVPATQMIAAIGNSGPAQDSDGSPGNYDITVGVGACDRNNAIALFSSWGRVAAHGGLAKPDLAAPGVDVRSAQPGGGFQLMSGTSMASPVVAGVAALLLEQSPSLRGTPSTLRQLILQNTIPRGPANRFGRGCIDLTNI